VANKTNPAPLLSHQAGLLSPMQERFLQLHQLEKESSRDTGQLSNNKQGES